MKRVVIATVVSLFMAFGAFAQMGHGRPGPGGPGGPGGGMAFEGPGGGNAIVGSDGTIYVTRTVVDTATNTSSTQVIAVRPSGTTAWTITLANRGHLTLSGANLLSVSPTRATDGTVSSTVSAISTATGAAAWSLNINGHITDLEPFSGGTYAIVVVPAASAAAAPARSLVAISPTGSILFTVNL
jgi:hypothetical protein